MKLNKMLGHLKGAPLSFQYGIVSKTQENFMERKVYKIMLKI